MLTFDERVVLHRVVRRRFLRVACCHFFKALGLLYHSTLGLRVIQKKKKACCQAALERDAQQVEGLQMEAMGPPLEPLSPEAGPSRTRSSQCLNLRPDSGLGLENWCELGAVTSQGLMEVEAGRVFNCLDWHQNSPDSGEIQYKSRT